MKRIWGFVFGGAVLAAGGAAALSACAHDDSTIFVQSVLAPQFVAPGTGCSYTSDPTQPFIASGTFDTALQPGYSATFLVANQLVPRGDPTAPATETSYVNIQGAIVQVNNSDGTLAANGNMPNPFTRLASVVIQPSQGTTPGFAPISVSDLIPPSMVASLGGLAIGVVDRLVVFVKFYGETLGDQYVESDNFEFPVDVCSGCLVGFSPADVNPCYTAPNCYGNGSSTSTSVTIPCSMEDFPVDCSACKGSPACDPPAAYVCTPGSMQCPCVGTAGGPDAGTGGAVDAGGQ
jgi:hypothetical protein